MIVKEQPTSWQLFFVMNGSIVPKIQSKLLITLVIAALILVVDTYVMDVPSIPIAAIGVFGVALSLFLGFRNNAAYQRWWEARSLWGAIVADARTFTREAISFSDDRKAAERLVGKLVASCHFLKGELRGTSGRQAASVWISPDSLAVASVAAKSSDSLLVSISNDIQQMAKRKEISEIAQLKLSQTLVDITMSQAGCERISNTPLPFVYSLLVRRTTYIYCWVLPFALVNIAGAFTPIIAVVTAYVFFGLQAVTRELEAPFIASDNALALDAMCRTIERSAADGLGRLVPSPWPVQNGRLT